MPTSKGTPCKAPSAQGICAGLRSRKQPHAASGKQVSLLIHHCTCIAAFRILNRACMHAILLP
jgi:hypothetical protein